MARKPSPWYRKERNEWCVTLDGHHHRLGEHPEGAARPERSKKTGRWNAPEQIERAFRKLLDGLSPDEAATASAAEGETVIGVLDAFITWCKENRKARTAGRYEELCQSFVRASVDGVKVGTLPVAKLSSRHVTAWLASQAGWGPTTKRNAITALQRGFNWAVTNLGLDRNPIKGMEKPQANRRTDVVTPAEFEKLLAAVKDQPFRDVLVISYDTGCRPQELKMLEARHIDLGCRRAVIPGKEAKGGITRTIYFPTDRSVEVIQRLVAARPAGPLFLNRLGNRWTGMAIKCRMEDLDGVLGRRVTHYSLRHSFVTRKLLAGVDSHVVAGLAGHKDTKMIDAVYSHVADDHEFMLREAMRDVTAEKPKKKKK